MQLAITRRGLRPYMPSYRPWWKTEIMTATDSLAYASGSLLAGLVVTTLVIVTKDERAHVYSEEVLWLENFSNSTRHRT